MSEEMMIGTIIGEVMIGAKDRAIMVPSETIAMIETISIHTGVEMTTEIAETGTSITVEERCSKNFL